MIFKCSFKRYTQEELSIVDANKKQSWKVLNNFKRKILPIKYQGKLSTSERKPDPTPNLTDLIQLANKSTN